MWYRNLRVMVFALLLIGLAVSPIGWQTVRSAQAQAELLINPGFEEPFTAQGGSVFVANGWQAWYLVPDGTTYPTTCPESAPETCKPYGIPNYRISQPQDQRVPPRARTGNSQQWGSGYFVFIGGVYQTVGNLTPGTRLRFSAYTQAFNCSNDLGCFGGVGEVGKSYEPGENSLRVGIDPTGGTNAFSPNIVWSGFANPLDAFVLQSVEAVAQGNTVTVFVWSAPQYSSKHVDIYVEDASLSALGQGAAPTAAATIGTPAPTATLGTPQPTATIPPNTGTYAVQAGDTLSAIAQAYNLTLEQLLALNPSLTRESVIQIGQVLNVGGTPQAATPTPLPTTTDPAAATPTATAAAITTLATSTPAPNGTPALANSGLCLSAFEDTDGSGAREPAETTLVAGVRFDVIDAQNQTVATYTSDGVEPLHCLSNLPDGRYTINITPPAGQTATTDAKWLVSLLSSTSFTINYGSRIAPEPTATSADAPAPTAQAEAAATPAPAARTTGVPLGLLIGGALILLAIAALAFAVSSRRR
ncbi:MAG: LysM peptidoglycan-binding domain-containing protein [Thermoflexales bacterium]|nr:LysM peptidoglycan-binding domain-containing protein [Thermoflexales bacterium]